MFSAFFVSKGQGVSCEGIRACVPWWKILPSGQKEGRGGLARDGFVRQLVFGKGWCMFVPKIAPEACMSLPGARYVWVLKKRAIISFIFLTIAISIYLLHS